MGIRTVLVGLCVVLAADAAMADFDSGCAAFERGDYQTARKEWQALAAQRHAQPQFRLGCLDAFGQGIPADHALALRLCRLAAEQGDLDAQNDLGGMYAEGLGVTTDPIEAYLWFALAANAGHEMAGKNRSIFARTMSAAQIGAAEARARAWRTAHE